MAITQGLATSFKVGLFDGLHNFGIGVIRASTAQDVFKIALYSSTATLDDTTTVYTTSNEVTGVGYTAGGITLTVSTTPTFTGTTAFLSFADASWPAATITARGALIYNSSQGNIAVAALDFGSDKTSTTGTFSVIFPAANSTSAILRLA
jgi:hypothetical protein